MAKSWGFALQSAVDGYMRGQRMVEDQELAEFRRQKMRREKEGWVADDALRADLRGTAGGQRIVEGVQKPDFMDNRDVGQPGEPALAPAPSGPTQQDAAAALNAVVGAANSVAANGRSAAQAYGNLQRNYQQAGAAALDQVGETTQATRAALAEEQQALSSGAPPVDIAPVAQAPQPRIGGATSAALASMGGGAGEAPPVGPPSPQSTQPVSAAQMSQGVGTPYFEVDGKRFGTRAEAETAVAARNSPAAMAARMGDVYMRHGQPEKALALADAGRQSVAQEMAQADAAWRRKLGRGMAGGLEGLVGVVNEAGGDLFGGQKAQLMPSADGKTFSLGTVGSDGAVSPVQGFPALTNDFEGIARAAWMLDQSVTPESRMTLFANERKAEALATKNAATAARDVARDAATAARSDRDYQLNREKFEETKRNNEATLNAKNKPAETKPLPSSALKMQQEGLDAIGTASSINADLAAIDKQITDGKLTFGPVSNLVNAGLNAAGSSTESSRNFASFKANMEKLRNDSLRLNKGVQTDGDAQRAWNELFQSINDTKVVQQRLTEIQVLNERAVQLRRLDIDGVRANYGHPPLDTSSYSNQSAVVGGARAAAPAASGDQARSRPTAGARMQGPGGVAYVFKGGDPKDRSNWEPAQ